MKASGLRNFRYVAFPPVVFEVPARAVAEEAVEEPVSLPGEPEIVLAPENEPPAPPEPMPALPPLAPRVEVPPEPVAMAAEPPAPEPIPDPPSWSRPAAPVAARKPGLRMLDEAAAAASPPPPSKPPEASRRFAMLDDIQTELRPRRARTGRQRPGDLL